MDALKIEKAIDLRLQVMRDNRFKCLADMQRSRIHGMLEVYMLHQDYDPSFVSRALTELERDMHRTDWID